MCVCEPGLGPDVPLPLLPTKVPNGRSRSRRSALTPKPHRRTHRRRRRRQPVLPSADCGLLLPAFFSRSSWAEEIRRLRIASSLRRFSKPSIRVLRGVSLLTRSNPSVGFFLSDVQDSLPGVVATLIIRLSCRQSRFSENFGVIS